MKCSTSRAHTTLCRPEKGKSVPVMESGANHSWSCNAGSFTNGMPQTASLGCGTWGGNITSENISVKHYMNTTWVSRPITEDKPDEHELLGEFYGSEIF